MRLHWRVLGEERKIHPVRVERAAERRTPAKPDGRHGAGGTSGWGITQALHHAPARIDKHLIRVAYLLILVMHEAGFFASHPIEDTIDFFHRPVEIEVVTNGALLREDRMAITPEMDTARIERTMRVVEYENDKPKIKRFIEESLEDPEAEPAVPTDWDLSFDEYLEEYKNSKLLFCWYTPAVGIVFSPSDHNGIWAGRLEGVKGKGTLPGYVQEVVERIAKKKGLA